MTFRNILFYFLATIIQPAFAVKDAGHHEVQDCTQYEQNIGRLDKEPDAYYFELGLCKANFINNVKNFNGVIELFRKSSEEAASTYKTEAYMAMGYLYLTKYEKGSLIFQTSGEASDLLNAINDLEHIIDVCPAAENLLGEIYLNSLNLKYENRPKSIDVPQEQLPIKLPDMEKAIYWLTTAAKHGNGAAQGTLSDLYEKGIGVPQDYLLAYVWQNLSVVTQSRYDQVMT